MARVDGECVLSIYSKNSQIINDADGDGQSLLQLQQKLKFRACKGTMEPEHFLYKSEGNVYLGIGDLVFKNWQLHFCKRKIYFEGLVCDIAAHLKGNLLHGNANIRIETSIESESNQVEENKRKKVNL